MPERVDGASAWRICCTRYHSYCTTLSHTHATSATKYNRRPLRRTHCRISTAPVSLSSLSTTTPQHTTALQFIALRPSVRDTHTHSHFYLSATLIRSSASAFSTRFCMIMPIAALRSRLFALYFLSCFCVAASGESDAEQIQPSDLAPSAVMRFVGSTVRNFWISSLAPGEMGSHQGEGKSYFAWRIVSKRACACVGRKEVRLESE